jgi:hypothetical protein
MRVAVVGGGLFGCTAALHLDRAGHDVHLFEVQKALMQGATADTYARLHRGYHYPRSPETGRESRDAEASFRAEYGTSVIDGGRQFYVVPDEGSRVSADEFQEFLTNEGLRFCRDRNLFRVVEPRLDLGHLQRTVRVKVGLSNVRVHTDSMPDNSLRDRFDQIIIATYAGLNQTLAEFGLPAQRYRYQVVERPIAFLSPNFEQTSMVIIDGPDFGCIDPLDNSSMHVLGHVTETIHAENTGAGPLVPYEMIHLVGRGLLPVIEIADVTRFETVRDSLAKHLHSLASAEHLGSSFCIRAVLADQEATDARPTRVDRLDDQVIRIFSGKLGCACKAAAEVVDTVEHAKVMAA